MPSRERITFEGASNVSDAGVQFVPSVTPGYGGFNWYNIQALATPALDRLMRPGSTEAGVTLAGKLTMINPPGAGHDAPLLHGAAYGHFDLRAGDFAAAHSKSFADVSTYSVEGYRGGVLVAQQTITVDSHRHHIRFDATFRDLDELYFEETGGTIMGMDNLRVVSHDHVF